MTDSTVLPRDVADARNFRDGTASARTTLRQRLNDGQALVTYAGHGSVDLWRDDLLTGADAATLQNGPRLPVVVALTCLNGLFQGLFPEESLAEALVRAPDGGAIAVWASSGLTEPEGQLAMSAAFYGALFSPGMATVGEAVVAAKQATADPDVRRTWIFFGDPAMRLAGRQVFAPLAGVLVPATAGPRRASQASGDAPPRETTTHDEAAAVGAPPVRLADFDGDGRADLLLVSGRAWRVVFSAAPEGPDRTGVWDTAWAVVVPGDLNGDGLADLVCYDPASGRWAEGLNTGRARFRYTTGTWGPQGTVQVADLDGDGRADVLWTDPASGRWRAARRDAAGRVLEITGQWPAAASVTVADLQGAGRPQIFLYAPDTGAASLVWVTRAGEMRTATGQTEPGWTVRAAHLTDPGRADLLWDDPASGMWAVCRWQAGPGTLTCEGGFWEPGAQVVLVDGAGGRDDVLRYDAATGAWAWSPGRAPGASRASGLWPAGRQVAVGDVDGDGQRDVVLVDPVTGAWTAALARGAGQWDYREGLTAPGWKLVGR